MRRWWILPLLALAVGCSEDGAPNSTQATTLSEQNEEAAVVIGESIALDSGGVLEAIEAAVLEELERSGGLLGAGPGKDRRVDDAVFDPETCTWTITQSRSHETDHSGFSWTQTTTKRFMDGDGGCVPHPDGDQVVQGLDLTRQFAGESWTPRSSGQRSGSGEWFLRGLHDDVPGVRVDGVHHRDGSGEVTRRRDGEPVVIEHSFTLDVDAHELVVVHRRGRRVPVAGWMHIVYHAERGDRVVDREVTLTFGDGGGRIAFPDGDEYAVDLVSGAID